MSTALPLGLHFGLPAEQHHADGGLGSSAIKQLAENPYEWWYNSPHNIRRVEVEDDEEESASRLFGNAVHCLLFDGNEAFARRYARGPNQKGMTQGEKSASTKKAKAEAAAQGRQLLKWMAYDRIVLAHETITRNPDTSTVFQNGMSEVTFIWIDEKTGVRCKARFDCIKAVSKQHLDGKLLAIGDLKSAANKFDINFKALCRQHICLYKYHAQARHYMNGAVFVPKAIRDGKVYHHGGPALPADFLQNLESCRHFAWQWLFCQSTGSAQAYSYWLSPGNQWFGDGQMVIDQAMANYQACIAKYGLANEWLMIEPPEELPAEEMGWRP
jgi:PDDEXK-like domain of unknown function (DUF3799)